MISEKILKYLRYTYAILLIAGTLYVYDVLKEDLLTVTEIVDENGNKEMEVKPININLEIAYEGTMQHYNVKLSNTNSFEDLLKVSGVKYEKISYIYGSEFEHINGVRPPEGFAWKAYEGESELKLGSKGQRLKEGTDYKLVLERISS
ncbi:hypothetical protein KAZ57_01585 [Patescibacteria group bacterium]|nr:hypothetical protein [Patescibacteria group bacterium]